MKKLIPKKIKNIYHLAQAMLASFYYGFPTRKMKIIGVTGTNGKTTTVQMITKILEEAGKKVAMASTINFKIGEKEWVNDTKYTTLSSWKIQAFAKKALEENCEYFILEISSHSLDQNRIWGIDFETAVITNVTREHLDYHKTMEGYRKAKLKLFKKAKKVVVNLNMQNPKEFLQFNNEKKFGYSIGKEYSEIKEQNVEIIQAGDINLNINDSIFQINNLKFKLNLPGEFNIENALAAISVGVGENINLEIIASALEKIKLVSGRMDRVKNNRGIEIIVDYAVTPDSLEKVYQLISKTKKENSKIISIFGACGERDRGKRPIMGKIVDKYADYIIVTNEDPYSEDPWQIINEVASGVKNKKEGENFWKIFDRREAIKKALILAKENDIFIITGKGAEETMAVGNERIPWNDKKIIEEELEK